MKRRDKFIFGFIIVLLTLSLAGTAFAATIWTDWIRASNGAPGTAVGSLNGVTVNYSGELDSATLNGSATWMWLPNGSFIGGTSTASPSVVSDSLNLNGNAGGTNTITFSSPVVNPLIAIWSLGSPSYQASFTFNITPTLEAGGPNASYGGSALSIVGNVVSGYEGNGVVQFTGTYSSISWTNTYENWYAFTVGTAGSTSVPEPATMLLLGLGLAGLAGVRRIKR